MICGGAQQLEDSVALNELLVSGVPVGGFSSAGWSELHLELRVRIAHCLCNWGTSHFFVFRRQQGRLRRYHERATHSLDNTVLNEYNSVTLPGL